MTDKIYTLKDGTQIAVAEASKKEMLEAFTDWLSVKKYRTGKWSILKKDGSIENLTVRTKRKIARNSIKDLIFNDLGGGYMVSGKYNVDYSNGSISFK